LHFPALDGPWDELTDAVLASYQPGSVVAVTRVDVRDALLARGATQVRHLYAMRHPLRTVPDLPAEGISQRRWQDGDAELLAPVLNAAYGPGHPDPRPPDDVASAVALRDLTDDPDNPLIADASSVAVVDDRPAGAALVVRSEHITQWHGPWLMNVFRDPASPVRGIGPAMIVHALRTLAANGESTLGLAVTVTNPALRLYHRLGFSPDLEAWLVVLP
jgi:GNAT superfamily N-acetyltransferase